MGLVPFSTQALTIDFQFDNTFDSFLSPPIVGTGTLTFDGDPGNGDYALTSLANYAFDFNFGSVNFGTVDLQTTISSIIVRIGDNSGARYALFESDRSGPANGSLDFLSGITGLSLEPSFGTRYGFDADIRTEDRDFSGNFADIAPVPLPATGILLLASLSGMGLLARRRKTA